MLSQQRRMLLDEKGYSDELRKELLAIFDDTFSDIGSWTSMGNEHSISGGPVGRPPLEPGEGYAVIKDFCDVATRNELDGNQQPCRQDVMLTDLRSGQTRRRSSFIPV